MRIKANNIGLKPMLTEATFQDAFNQIQKGDTFTVKSGSGVMTGTVVDKYANQIMIKYGDDIFVLTDNSLQGNTLVGYTRKEVDGNMQRIKYPIKGVYNIQIKRNGQPVVGVQTDTGRPSKAKKRAKSRSNIYKDRYEDLVGVFNEFEKDDKMVITTGKLITKGKDKGGLAKNTITTFTIHVEKVGNNMIRGGIISIEGAEASKYQFLEDGKLFFAKQSISLTDEGIVLTPVFKSGEDTKKIQIPNVFSIDNEGSYIDKPEVTMQDLMDSPRIRAMMYKNPSLFDRIMGYSGPKGIVPAEKALKDLGMSTKKKKGKKVKFKYFGEDYRQGYRFNFKDGKTYVGKFTKDDVIKRTSDNRRESMYLTVGKKLDDKTYEVDVTHVIIKNGEAQREELGKGKIRIVDTNF